MPLKSKQEKIRERVVFRPTRCHVCNEHQNIPYSRLLKTTFENLKTCKLHQVLRPQKPVVCEQCQDKLSASAAAINYIKTSFTNLDLKSQKKKYCLLCPMDDGFAIQRQMTPTEEAVISRVVGKSFKTITQNKTTCISCTNLLKDLVSLYKGVFKRRSRAISRPYIVLHAKASSEASSHSQPDRDSSSSNNESLSFQISSDYYYTEYEQRQDWFNYLSSEFLEEDLEINFVRRIQLSQIVKKSISLAKDTGKQIEIVL